MRRLLRANFVISLALVCGKLLPGQATPGAGHPSEPAVSPQSYPLAKYLGLTVHNVTIQAPPALDLARLREMLAVQAGQALDRDSLRESIEALYRTGFFQDLEVQAERLPTGEVSLTLVLKPNYFVGAVSIEGAPKGPPTHSQLVNSTRLDLGELLTAQDLELGIAGIKETLADNAYHAASVTAGQSSHPATQQSDVGFAIQPGPKTRIGHVDVTGDTGFSADEVRAIARLRPGDAATAQRSSDALLRLRKAYQRQGRLEVQAAIVQKEYDAAHNLENYVLQIERGPVVKIRVNGASFSDSVLRKSIPVYEESAVDNDLLAEGARNLRDYLQTRGYYDARVEFLRQQQSGMDEVIFDIHPGEQQKLVAIAVEGNRYFSSDLLRERMLVQPSSVLVRHGRYSQSLANADAQSIANLYKANGFADVKVEVQTISNYKNAKGQMKVVFHISEGPQTHVALLKIEGNEVVPSELILQHVTSTEGQPFSDSNVASDREELLNFYFNQGFTSAQFEATATPVTSEPPQVNLVYRIQEGQRVFVSNVLVSGLHFTKPSVVQKQLQLRRRDPLSLNAMLDTQRRLYDLGLFNAVDIAVQNPNGRATEKQVLLQMEEARRYTFDYGLGLEVQSGGEPGSNEPQGRTGVSPRVSFGVTRINLAGSDRTLLFKGAYGRLEQRALLSYLSPRWLDHENWKLILTGLFDTSRDVRTFTSQRSEGSIQIEDKLSRITTLLYGFAYRHVIVSDLQISTTSPDFPILSRPERVGLPTFAYIRDKRDDPLESHKGNYTVVDTAVAASAFGSADNFSRVLITNSTYHTFRKRWVFARNTRIGIENIFGGSDVIPLPERFYAGGFNSHRGFALNQAGPRDPQTGFPLGGGGLFLNQLELRFPPLTLPFIDSNLSPVIFHDMGNVFETPNEILSSSIRIHQPNSEQCRQFAVNCDFNYFSHAVGGGLRYRTPIGPVRLDVGYNLNPPFFAVEGHSDQLHHVNFSFSLGQTF